MTAADREAAARRQRAQEIALWRWTLVEPAMDPALTARQRGQVVRDLASREHAGPDGRRMAAVSRRVDQPHEEIMFGFGAHLDPRIAVRRALTELNQMMPALVGTADFGQFAAHDPDSVRWWREATVASQPYLLPDPTATPRTPASYGYTPYTDILDEITLIQRRIEDLGMHVLVLDQTRPDIGLPVVKVIVPGLRHFWARFAPGRLYDVPVALGRLATPTAYDDLNPLPMFL